MRLRIKYIKINKINSTFFMFRKNYVLIVFLIIITISPYAESERRGKKKKAKSEKRL